MTDDDDEQTRRNSGTMPSRAGARAVPPATPDRWSDGSRDAAEPARADAALRDGEAWYRSLVDHSPDAILVHRQGTVVYVNAAACVLLRAPSADALLGTSAFDRVHPDWRGTTRARAATLTTPGAVVPPLEARFVRLDGTSVTTETVASAIRYDGDAAIQVVIRDISARRDAEAARRESEALVRLCVKRTPAAVAMVDRDMRYLAVSDRWLADYGLGEADVAGRTHYELFPELPDAWRAIHQRVLAGETDRCDEAAFARPDGRTEWIRWELVPWYTAAGAVGGLIMFTEVITARKELELAVRTSDARFRAAVDASSDAFFILGVVRDAAGAPADYRYVEANGPGGAMFSMAPADLLGRGLCELFPVLRGGTLVAHFTAVADTGVPYAGEYETRDPRTVARWVWLQVVPLRDDAGVVASLAVSAQDISARKRADAELRLVHQVTHALSAAHGVGSALRTALEQMCRAAELPYGEAWVPAPAPDGGAATVLRHGPVWSADGDARLAAFGVASDAYTFARGEGLPGRAWQDGVPVVTADLLRNGAPDPSRFPRAVHARASGMRSVVALPVLADGETVAVLTFFTRAGDPPVDQRVVDLLSAVAAQVGLVLRRKVAEAALEEERHFLASVLDSLSEHVSVCDADGRLTLVNRAARQAHGLPAHGDVTPEVWRARAAPSPDGAAGELPVALVPHVDALLAGADVSGTEYLVHAAGQPPRTMEANVRVLRAADGACVGSVCAARDVTAERAAEAALRASEARLSLIYNASSDLMYLARVAPDADGLGTSPDDYAFESVNDAYLDATGLRHAEVTGRTLGEVLPAAVAGPMAERFAMAAASTDTLRYDEDLALLAGPRTVETTLTPLYDERDACSHLLGVMRDVTVRRQAEAAVRHSEAQFRGVLETVRSIAVTLDKTGAVTFVNNALLSLTGWTREEVLGTEWFERFVPDRDAVRAVFAGMMTYGECPAHYENEILTRAGERRLIAWDNTLLRDASGAIVGTASVGRDTTDQRALEARLAALSEHDELTGLLNRRGFNRMAMPSLRSAARSNRRDAVLYIDLDRFKPINDTHGHAAGDGALRAVADVLRATVRDADFCARLGGDEFAVFAVGVGEGQGHVLASRLRAALDAQNVAASAAGRAFEIGFSVGVAELEAGDDLDALLARADAALYAQKLARRQAAPPA